MDKLRDRAAQASGRYTDDEWAALVASGDTFDKLTVANARTVASNILSLPEIAEALKLQPIKDLGMQRRD